MSFSFKTDFGDIVIDDISDNIDNWIVKDAEVIEYSKATVLVEAFESQFPHIKLLGNSDDEKFDYLTNLVSRSDKLLQWFALEKVNYSELTQLPSYLTDVIDKSEFKKIRSKITEVNNVIADFAEQRAKLALEYKANLRKLERQLDAKIDKSIGNDNVVKVLTLTSQSMPLSLINAIESYNPQTSDINFDEKKKLYARELLTRFKVSLLKKVNEDPDIDIDTLIDEISLK
jgi:hypothetical protein